MLPASIAMPTKVLTHPSALSPPFSRGIISAGSIASYIDAIRFIAARNNISHNMPRFVFRYFRPLFAADSTVSFFSLSPAVSGIFMNSSSERNAARKVTISTANTANIPKNDITEVASTGVSIVTSEFENERIPLIF